MAAEHEGEALMEYARVPKLAGRSLREDGSSASESSCTSSESESEASTSESATTESSDHESPFEEEPGDAAIKLAAAGVQSGTASEVMPESGCAKRAGVTGKLDTVDAQNKPAGEATSSGQYPRLRHMSRCCCGYAYGNSSHHCMCRSRTRELVRAGAPRAYRWQPCRARETGPESRRPALSPLARPWTPAQRRYARFLNHIRLW